MTIKCTDCNKELERVQFVRRLRPGEYYDHIWVSPDPLCKDCGEADNKEVEHTIKKRTIT